MAPTSNRLPNVYPGGSPFPPGGEPTPEGVIKLFVAAGGAIEWTHLIITPAMPTIYQPIRVLCEGCDFNIIAPDEKLQILFLSEQQDTSDPTYTVDFDGPSYTVDLDGPASLIIWLHRRKHEEEFFWPRVTVKYYRDNQVIGETSWWPPEEE